ncbi:MAG: hypothetical protein AB3N11_17705 [Arenibacterium sp.]
MAIFFALILSQTAFAQDLATLNSSGKNMTVAEFASHTWQATSTGGGVSHVAELRFAMQGNKLVGTSIYWPGSNRTAKLAVESINSKSLVASTLVEQACGQSRKIKYEMAFKKRRIALKVSGPKSRCRQGTFQETGKVTRK